MSKWINIKKRLPNDNEPVLIAGNNWVMIGVFCPYLDCGDGAFSGYGYEKLNQQPTHWRPLPGPPKD